MTRAARAAWALAWSIAATASEIYTTLDCSIAAVRADVAEGADDARHATLTAWRSE